MDRYAAFRWLMDYLADHCEVTGATMNDYLGNIEVTGIDKEGKQIRITMEIKEVQDGAIHT